MVLVQKEKYTVLQVKVVPLVLFALFHVYSYLRPDTSALGDKDSRNSGVEMSGRGDTLVGLHESDLECGLSHGGPRSTFSPLSLPSSAARQQNRTLPAVPVSANAVASPVDIATGSKRVEKEGNEEDGVKKKEEEKDRGIEGTAGPEADHVGDGVVVVHNILLQPKQE